MDDNAKRSLKQLMWSVLITVINGLITIFNPATKEVANVIVNSFNC